jgi:hypothetical protein
MVNVYSHIRLILYACRRNPSISVAAVFVCAAYALDVIIIRLIVSSRCYFAGVEDSVQPPFHATNHHRITFAVVMVSGNVGFVFIYIL